MSTLFSYFNKTPKAKGPPSPACSEIADKKKSNSPKEEAQGFPSINQNKARANGKAEERSILSKNEESCSAQIQLYDILWAKLEGHPWWPSLVCNHPTQGIFQLKDKCHVQFFGEPPSRAWVKTRQVKPFVKKFNNNVGDPTAKKAARRAEDALSLTREERKELVNCLPSDDEEESTGDSEQTMQLDGSLSIELSGQKRKIADDSLNKDGDDDDDEDEVTGRKSNSKRPRRKATLRNSKMKKRRVIESGSEGDSEDDYKPDVDAVDDDDDDESCSSGVDENESEDEVHSEDEIEENTEKPSRKRKRGKVFTPHQNKTKTRKPSTPRTPNTSSNVASMISTTTPSAVLPGSLTKKVSSSASKAAESLARFQMSSSPTNSPNVDNENGEGSYTHEKLDWLKEDKRRDKHGRPVTHPEYDSRTLLVPSSFLNSKDVTPAMKQWWQLKAENYDTVLFFKIGKFYELYNMDATVGVKELGLIYMRGNFAHAGFPEIAFGRYSDTLIEKGYKVARVEQTETPEMMKERCKKIHTVSRSDQVVKREICAVITKGTKTYSFLDGDCTDSEAAYLLAISEKGSDDSGESCYGVCFVDTSIGKFHIGQFQDDRQASRLRTLVAHYTPVQVLCPRGGLMLKTQHVLNHELMSSMKEYLIPASQFWEPSKTLKVFAEEEYFKENNNSTESSVKSWPDVLKKLTDGDPIGLTPGDNSKLALSSLGAVVWYLKKCLIDHEVLSMGNFEEYIPLDSSPNIGRSAAFVKGRQHMILDNITLTNLEIIPNGPDSSTEGTLLEKIDHCSTAFGKRLFKQWLCAPLCNPSAINDRLNAVEDFMANQGLIAECKELLCTLPDLERLLKKIHTLSLPKDQNHPAHRAILYNEDTYSKRKINDFLTVLEGFSKATEIVALFRDHSSSFRSKLLSQVVSEEGQFPRLQDLLFAFKHAFDHNKARNEGVILPKPGVDPDYDGALADINAATLWFDQYLKKQSAALGCRVTYWGSAKNRYQLEVPDSIRKIPDEYTLQSQKKGFKRYWTAKIEDKLAELVNAEERREEALKDTMRHVFHKFDQEYKTWDQAVQCLAVLDSLISLASYSSQCDGPMCRPEIVLPELTEAGDYQPFLEIRDGRHPCISRTFSGGEFIPNDTVIGIKDVADCEETAVNSQSTCVLVTGPNMGGKSTLMRQAGLIVIMAQMGCFVPAEKCRLTPVDRVFTRLGAQDRILSGESTFFVELNETSTILKHATQHSLVIVDELGRGTATYDGTAIACAVVSELSRQIRCRTLFSTHYHSLVEEFSADQNVRLGHMACMVENEDDTDPSQETITFLYKFVKGACPKSYGFNAARLAGIPDEVIALAVKKARQFEESTERAKFFRQLLAKNKYSHQDILNLRERFH